jgi:hypothetical protein
MSNITLVTGLWDLGRGELSEGWSRSFKHYLNKFEELLKQKADKEAEVEVIKKTNPKDMYVKDLEKLKKSLA